MSFYIRKSITLGGLRFNFSKSGIGASVGAKGFRFGVGPRGNYVHMGRNGVYYRTALSKKDSQSSTNSNETVVPIEKSLQYEENQLLYQEIESRDISFIVDASSRNLVDEINQNYKKNYFWPYAIVLALIPVIGVYVAILVALGLYFFIDRPRKTAILFYDIEKETELEIQNFYNAFNELITCAKKWHVSAEANVRDGKYYAGANSVVKRTPITIKYGSLPRVKTNIRVLSIPVGRQTLYFLPDRILIYQGKQVGGLSYDSLRIKSLDQQFIETDSVPCDGKVVAYTWRYVNKSGNPDKRFKDNPKLPIMLYSDVQFTSSTGLNELIELSKSDIGKELNEQLIHYSRKGFLVKSEN